MFTIISLLIAVPLMFYQGPLGIDVSSTGGIIAGFGALFFFMAGLTISLSYIPLQKAEESITPSLFDLYRKDKFILFAPIAISAFTLFSVLLGLNQDLLNFVKPLTAICIWIISLGIALDLFGLLWRRTAHFLNPFKIVSMFSQSAKKSIHDDKDIDLCDSIDALAEIATRAVNRTNMALGIESISELRHVGRVFLESSKTLGHEDENPELKSMGIRDKVSFILFYLLQRFEMIHEHALDRKLEPICSFIITALGKITIFSAQYDITMTSYPLHFLNKLAMKALSRDLNEVGVKATLAILEIAKAITTEMNVTYMELQPTFLTMINILDNIAKETFKRDKTTNIRVLIQPFINLREMFQTEKMAGHQDTPVILLNIDKVIKEFETLEAVLKTMPPMPSITPEEEPK